MKQTLKTFFLLTIVLLLMSPNSQAQRSKFSPGLGIGLKASTNGIGANLTYNVSPQIALRLGYEKMGYSKTFAFDEQGISYNADISFSAGSISLLADFYLGKYIFISAGAGYNLFHLQLDGAAGNSLPFGDIEIPQEMIGDFSMQVGPSLKISPYVGIGFGRTLSFEKRVGFAFEIGTFYQGNPDLSIASTGLLSPTSNPDHGQEELLEHQLRRYSMYPIVKLSLNYKIFSF